MKKQISIIGCGWLGFPLAKHLHSEGYKIKGSTTSTEKLESLNKASINGFLVSLNEKEIQGNYQEFLADSETIIINIPPGLRKNPNKDHIREISHLITAIEASHIKNVLYISSTSVFKDEEVFPVIDGKTQPNADTNSAKQLITTEKMLLENPNFNTTILRFSGLFDTTRHPGNFLSGKKNISNPKAPINLIHKEDCIAIISSIVKNSHWNIILNASFPLHPTKEHYYTSYCRAHSLDLPEFNFLEKSKGKLIEATNLVQLLNYTFKQAP